MRVPTLLLSIGLLGAIMSLIIRQISLKGIDIIKQFEAFRPSMYYDDSGRPHIGYGHLIKTTEPELLTATLSQDAAERLLNLDLMPAQNVVANAVKVPLNQNQFDALTSLAFNIGSGAFETSTLVKKLNARDYDGAAEQILVWNKVTDPNSGVKGTNIGLVRRRNLERELFVS